PAVLPHNLGECGVSGAGGRPGAPVHAICVAPPGAPLDREACARNVSTHGGECFDCLLACKHVVLSLRRFKRFTNGRIAAESLK
ncbi:MAG: hypothetical protein Q6353_010030, partial [Candidatus Sigynarchaeum springense]